MQNNYPGFQFSLTQSRFLTDILTPDYLSTTTFPEHTYIVSFPMQSLLMSL